MIAYFLAFWLIIAGKLARLFFLLSLSLVILYRFVPVPLTPLMLIRSLEQIGTGQPGQWCHTWVPLANISSHLQLAVVCSEDQRFLEHQGFDLKAIEYAIKVNKQGKKLRGGSTITQQMVKNIFLWPARSWVRKGLEAYLTVVVELLWSKERILEVYLNSIEMGPGVYGAEAASQHYWKIPATKLSQNQAATIAAILPNPRFYKANPPGSYTDQQRRYILGQMRRRGQLTLRQ
jgi:monofunctional glycosyltransferase